MLGWQTKLSYFMCCVMAKMAGLPAWQGTAAKQGNGAPSNVSSSRQYSAGPRTLNTPHAALNQQRGSAGRAAGSAANIG